MTEVNFLCLSGLIQFIRVYLWFATVFSNASCRAMQSAK
jgi:hypothetical protein